MKYILEKVAFNLGGPIAEAEAPDGYRLHSVFQSLLNNVVIVAWEPDGKPTWKDQLEQLQRQCERLGGPPAATASGAGVERKTLWTAEDAVDFLETALKGIVDARDAPTLALDFKEVFAKVRDHIQKAKR